MSAQEKLIEKPIDLPDFAFLDRVRNQTDELYYQLRLLPRLSINERREIFSGYSVSNFLKVIKWMHNHERGGDFLRRRILGGIVDKLLDLVQLVDQERSKQAQMGILKQDSAAFESRTLVWKHALIEEFKQIALPDEVRQRLTMSLLRLPGDDSQKIAGKVVEGKAIALKSTLLDYRLEELFFKMFSKGGVDRQSLTEFMQHDPSEIMDFLEHKLEAGKTEEKANALELVRYIPRRKSVVLASRIAYHNDGELQIRGKEILNWMKSRKSFSEFLPLIDFYLDRVSRRQQLVKMETTLKVGEDRKRSIMVEYFTYLKQKQ